MAEIHGLLIPPPDPRKRPERIYPTAARHLEAYATHHDLLVGVTLPRLPVVAADAPNLLNDAIKSACVRAAKVATQAIAIVERVEKELEVIRQDQDTSATRKAALAIAVIDTAIREVLGFEKPIEEANHFRSKLSALLPSDDDGHDPDGVRARFILRTVTDLDNEARLSLILAEIHRLNTDHSDGEGREFLRVILRAPRIWRNSVLPSQLQTERDRLLSSLNPDVVWCGEWLRFCTDQVGLPAYRAVYEWLSQRRSEFGGETVTLVLPSNGREA